MENRLHKPYYYGFADLDAEREAKKWTPKQVPTVVFVFSLILAIVAICICIMARPKRVEAAEINMDAIAQIESSNNPLAYNRHSGARGKYQITQPVLTDYNKRHGTTYKPTDLFNTIICRKIAYWYINVETIRLLKHYHLPITVENQIRVYNCGIRSVIRGYTPRETALYLKKYARLQ
jgi:hypothetical protein